MIKAAIAPNSEAEAKTAYGVQHWIDDLPYQQAQERLVSQPTVNIEGLVGGYTGPGGKTVLPHRAVAEMLKAGVGDVLTIDKFLTRPPDDRPTVFVVDESSLLGSALARKLVELPR